jgi:hypothetical protein
MLRLIILLFIGFYRVSGFFENIHFLKQQGVAMAKGDIIIFEKNIFQLAYEYVRFDMMQGQKPPKSVIAAFTGLAGGIGVALAAGSVYFNAGSTAPTVVPITNNQNILNYARAQGCNEVLNGSDDPLFKSEGFNHDVVIPPNEVSNCVLTGRGSDIVQASAQPDKINGDDIFDISGNFLTNPTPPGTPARAPYFDRVEYRRSTTGVSIDLMNPLNNKGEYAIGDTYKGIEAFTLTRFNDTFRGTLAGNNVEAGGGTDTAFFKEPLSRYTLTPNGRTITVAGPDGAGFYSGFERFQFADKLVTATATGELGVIDRDQVGTPGVDNPLNINPTALRVFGDLGQDWFVPHAAGCPDGKIQVFGEDTKNLETGEIIRRPNAGFNTMDYSAQPDRLVYHQTDESKIQGSIAQCYVLNGIQRIRGSAAVPAEPNTYQNLFYAGPTTSLYVGGTYNDGVFFKGNYADYTIALESNNYTLTVTPKPGTNTGEGVTRLERIDTLFFNDGSLHKQEPFKPYQLTVDINTEITVPDTMGTVSVRVMPPDALGAVVYFGPKLGEILNGPNAEANIRRIITERMNAVTSPGFDENGIGQLGSALGEGTRFNYMKRELLTKPKNSFALGHFDGPNFQQHSYTKSERIGVLIMWVMPVNSGVSLGNDTVFAPYHQRSGVPGHNRHLTEILNNAYVISNDPAGRAKLLDNGLAAACWTKRFYPTQLQQHIDAAAYNMLVRQLYVDPNLTDAACAKYTVRNLTP